MLFPHHSLCRSSSTWQIGKVTKTMPNLAINMLGYTMKAQKPNLFTQGTYASRIHEDLFRQDLLED
ncbi:hypothetical protein ASG24_07355 [Methylophilus sp. Leaf414]|nr:hypothetical protein ASG24_07355 [Methylophilus sp. Leaf414]